MIIIMTMPCYKNGKSLITATCYKNGDNDNKSDNNEDKICLLLRRWDLVGHMLDHILDHVLDQIIDHMLDHMLDYIIISLVTMTL